MPKYGADDVRRCMDDVTKVRNICMLGAMGHGKSSIVDNLGAMTGYVPENKVGEQLFTLYRADEKERKTNIKSNGVHFVFPDISYQAKDDKDKVLPELKKDTFMMNVQDTPGHIEYSPETVAALRMCDSSLICVDGTSGVNVGLEYMVADSLKERVRPCMFINKIDIMILVKKNESEEIYQELAKCVTSLNIVLNTAEKLGLKWEVDPAKGDVIFGSAYYGWAFALSDFAKMYASKFGVEEDKMAARLWGDQFFNAKKKTWTKVEVEGSKRGFCQFIMDPIISLHNAIMADDEKKWDTMCTKLGIALEPADKKLKGKPLLKTIMMKWMNCGNAVTRMLATHSQNPAQCQKMKCHLIYKGQAEEDEEGNKGPEPAEIANMQKCDPEGPVLMHVVRLQPTGASGRFYVVGRVFSGTVKNDKYHLRGADYDPEDPTTFGYSQDGRPQSVLVQMGKDAIAVPDIPAGNICMLQGVDQLIMKSCTLTNNKKMANFTNLKFNVSAVLKVAIKPTDNKTLPKLVEGLKRLQKSDILVTYDPDESGNHIIGGCGNEHLKTLISDLRNEYAGVPFEQGVPTVSYKETVTAESPKPALSKSPNKHNRLYIIAAPLEEDLVQAIETHKINPQQEMKKRARIMIDEYGWEKGECMKIWGFGPVGLEVGGANVLVDMTKGIQYLNEIRESCNSGLLWASKEGPLAEENMRGIRFNLMDAKLHADSIHRGMGQIQPTARRVFYAATLTSEPRFLEPVFKAVLACPEEAVAGVRQALMAKRGEVQYEEEVDGKCVVVAFLPIAETLGNDAFAQVLQTKTSGKAFATYAFDHWQEVTADPLVEGSKAETIMFNIRERKGLKIEQPDLSEYFDRL